MPKLLTVVGNRPQFVKLGNTARKLREMGSAAPFQSVVVNTGQHYDAMLSDVFFSELQIEKPDYDLGMGSGHIVDQIGKMLPLLREVLETERPDGLLVYGDTNSTIAGAIAAAHLGVPVFHVEGGERLYRRVAMPEEINRIATDHLSDVCLCSSRKAVRYLEREGFGPERAIFVGDPMYDIFVLSGEVIARGGFAAPADYGLEDGGFILSTIHRAENTDDRETALAIMEALDAAPMPVLLPAHPRLRSRLAGWGWSPRRSLRLIDPLGYFDFQGLLRRCALLVSDSGGVNREAFFAGKGCIVPLDSSAWIEAVEAGFATTVGQDPDRLAAALAGFRPSGDVDAIVRDQFGQGDAAEKIIATVDNLFQSGRVEGEGPWHPLGHYPALPKPAPYPFLALGALRERLDLVKAAGGELRLVHAVTGGGLASAVEMARIEAEAGQSGTFCFPVDDPDFNPFAPDAVAAAGRIAASGHALGLLATAPSDTAAVERGLALLELAHGVEPSLVLVENGAGLPERIGAVAVLTAGSVGSDFDLQGGARSGDGSTIVLHPELWEAIPTSPLESALRTADAARDRRLTSLRDRLPELRVRALAGAPGD